MFRSVYAGITEGTEAWRALTVNPSTLYEWSDSTYIHQPPFFTTMEAQPSAMAPIKGAYCLLNLGDSITTDHISPAGTIARTSPAAQFLQGQGVAPAQFNTYGARRGNDLVMARGTFANARIVNKMMDKPGPKTIHVPSGDVMFTFDAAQRYQEAGESLVVLGGQLYGSGSSRDWAAKGPFLQGVRTVIAQSFERIHRSNLVGMGVLPLEFLEGESADTLGLTGKERFTIELPTTMGVNDEIRVLVEGGSIESFKVKTRVDTAIEVEYLRHGGILQYVLRSLLKK
jgi:aconitate hydratase